MGSNQPQPVLCVDMTKIVSAESYFNRVTWRDTKERPLADPDGMEDFRDLIDLYCNDTLIETPRYGNVKGAGPIYSAISRLMTKLREVRVPRSNEVVESSVDEDSRTALPLFASYAANPQVARKIERWVEFQITNERLQEMFNASNSTADMAQALEAYKMSSLNEGYRNNLYFGRLLRSGTDIGWAGAFNRDYLSWDRNDFYVAYAYWGFVKGVRYARYVRSVPETGVYFEHWLRREAVYRTDCPTIDAQPEAVARVPWGEVVDELLTEIDVAFEIDDRGFGDALWKLRRYTVNETQNEGNLSTTGKRRAFLREGIETSFSDMLRERKRPSESVFEKLATAAGAVVAPHLGNLVAAVGFRFGLDTLSGWVKPAGTRQRMNILVSPAYLKGRVRNFIEGGLKKC